MKIAVVVVDDQENRRAGFAALFDTQPDITVVGTAADGEEGCASAARSVPTSS